MHRQKFKSKEFELLNNLKFFGNFVDYAKNLRSTNIEKLPSLHFEADMYPWSMLVL